jgi:hypothetical protein
MGNPALKVFRLLDQEHVNTEEALLSSLRELVNAEKEVKSSTSSPAQSDNLGLTTKAKILLHRRCGAGGFYATRKHHQK